VNSTSGLGVVRKAGISVYAKYPIQDSHFIDWAITAPRFIVMVPKLIIYASRFIKILK
jgi:hypothetical protein